MKTVTTSYTCDICGGLIERPYPYNVEHKIEMVGDGQYTSVTIHHVGDHVGAEHICSECLKRILRETLAALGG